MKKKIGTVILSIIIIFLMVGLDQWTKWAVVKTVALGERIDIIHNFFEITYVQNTGAGFSLFEGFGITFFAVLTIAALVVMAYMFIQSDDQRMQGALTLVFSGALGNFIDRMRFGYVRDFFSFNLLGWDFPVFNVADVCICCGFALILAFMLYDEYKEKKRWKKELSK